MEDLGCFLSCPRENIPVGVESSDKKDGDAAASGSTLDASEAATPGSTKMSAGALAGTSGAAVDVASGGAKSAVEKMIEKDEGPKQDLVVVPVFKVAVRLVKECLWKDEVGVGARNGCLGSVELFRTACAWHVGIDSEIPEGVSQMALREVEGPRANYRESPSIRGVMLR